VTDGFIPVEKLPQLGFDFDWLGLRASRRGWLFERTTMAATGS
jgi:hypothetical protein